MSAGESHGPSLMALLEGIPAGLALVAEDIDRDLARRQRGYGRGGRMKIERDRALIEAGVRGGETLGSPIALRIENRDFANWQGRMGAAPFTEAPEALVRPRPGHADLAGGIKYDRRDLRDVLERASARETAARVACGGVAKKALAALGVTLASRVVSIAGVVDTNVLDPATWAVGTERYEALESSELRVTDAVVEAEMKAAILAASHAGDTVGGVVECAAVGLPVGLGSHVHWDRKLDGRLAGILMSIPAVKAVEIGMGFEAARRPGSEVHDPIEAVATPGRPAPAPALRGGYRRRGNNAGGLEGGITTGEPLVIRVGMKPIATLMSPLPTIDLRTGLPAKAQAERSDVTAVPAMGVIAEALTAWVLADAMLEKFGGDSLRELRRNYEGYLEQLAGRWTGLGGPVPETEDA